MVEALASLPAIPVGQLNVPESGKRGLLRPAKKRAAMVVNFLNKRGLIVAGCEEAGKNLLKTVKKRPFWVGYFATPNSRAWGNRQGNAILVKNKVAKIIDHKQLSISGLHTPVALVRHKRGFRFAVIAAHVPTGRAGITSRRSYNGELERYLQVLKDANIPTVLLADSNSDKNWVKGLPHVRMVEREHVDVIAASNHFIVEKTWHTRRPLLSDHPFIGASLRPVKPGNQVNKLP